MLVKHPNPYYQMESMKICVDEDTCPKPVKENLFRIEDKTEIILTLIALIALRAVSRARKLMTAVRSS